MVKVLLLMQCYMPKFYQLVLDTLQIALSRQYVCTPTAIVTICPLCRLIGTENEKAYLRIQGQDEKRDVTDVQCLAHALRNDSQDETQLTVG